MGQEIVSIIIPIYNVEKYLDRCVESACNQTYKHLQIILVDDGSPDMCPQMCDDWAKKDSRIQVIHKKNGGLSDARNAGLDVARGKYIYFLDGDDYVEPTLVETALWYMTDGVDMVVFPCFTHRTDGTVYKSPFRIGKYLLPDGKSRADFTIDTLLQWKIGWEAWSRLYIRANIEKFGLRFEDNKEIFAEDLYFCLCYCAHANQVVCIPDCLYHYIHREDSIMGHNTQKLNVGRMSELATRVKAYYERTGDCEELLAVFPEIYYYIIINVVEKARCRGLISGKEGRKLLLQDLDDRKFFTKNIHQVIKHHGLLENNDSGSGLADKLNYLQYILDGNYPLLALRSRLLSRFGKQVNDHLGYTARIKREANRLTKEKYDIYVIGTEDFGNIGDHQIACSMLAFLQELYPEKKIREITASMYFRFREALKKSISPNALIVLPGGGNFGDIYPVAQKIRQDVIDTWKKNTKIVFPQTIHFSNTDRGHAFLEEAKKTYTESNNVILVTREEASHFFAKKNFSCRCLLIPDIVLHDGQERTVERDRSVLYVLRSDDEKSFKGNWDDFQSLAGRYAQKLDHQLTYSITLRDREDTVEWVLEQYHKARLVITDRLHGMVFAAITGTPCIAFGNYNHKVSGTYKWISYLPYIRYAESIEQAEQWIPELLEMGGQKYDSAPLMPYFEELAQVVRKYANN